MDSATCAGSTDRRFETSVRPERVRGRIPVYHRYRWGLTRFSADTCGTTAGRAAGVGSVRPGARSVLGSAGGKAGGEQAGDEPGGAADPENEEAARRPCTAIRPQPCLEAAHSCGRRLAGAGAPAGRLQVHRVLGYGRRARRGAADSSDHGGIGGRGGVALPSWRHPRRRRRSVAAGRSFRSAAPSWRRATGRAAGLAR